MSFPSCTKHRHASPESARDCAWRQDAVKRKRRERLTERATLPVTPPTEAEIRAYWDAPACPHGSPWGDCQQDHDMPAPPEHEIPTRIELSPEAMAKVEEMLRNPAPPTQALIDLMRGGYARESERAADRHAVVGDGIRLPLLSREQVADLMREGDELRREVERRTEPMKQITASDLTRRSK